ncbi:MAG: hypothetical protein ABMA64_02525 [Myxococcota bacterium]
MSDEDDPFYVENAALSFVNAASGGILHDLAHVFERLGIKTASARMNTSIMQSHAEWLEERVKDLEQGYQALRDKGIDAQPTDARPIAEAIDRAFRRTADPSKRKLLELAATHAFDQELYELGLTLVLLEKLERLTYGQIALLRKLSDGQYVSLPTWVSEPGSIDHFLTEGLIRSGLVRSQRGVDTDFWLSASSADAVGITGLGQRMLALLSEPEPQSA